MCWSTTPVTLKPAFSKNSGAHTTLFETETKAPPLTGLSRDERTRKVFDTNCFGALKPDPLDSPTLSGTKVRPSDVHELDTGEGSDTDLGGVCLYEGGHRGYVLAHAFKFHSAIMLKTMLSSSQAPLSASRKKLQPSTSRPAF